MSYPKPSPIQYTIFNTVSHLQRHAATPTYLQGLVATPTDLQTLVVNISSGMVANRVPAI